MAPSILYNTLSLYTNFKRIFSNDVKLVVLSLLLEQLKNTFMWRKSQICFEKNSIKIKFFAMTVFLLSTKTVVLK